jgi:hypothetical protein
LVSKPAAQAPKTTPITSDAGTGAAGKPRGGLLAGHSPEDDQWAHLTVWELWGWVRARAGTPDHRVARARPPWPTPASSPSGRGTDDLLGPDRLLRPLVQLAGNLNGSPVTTSLAASRNASCCADRISASMMSIARSFRRSKPATRNQTDTTRSCASTAVDRSRAPGRGQRSRIDTSDFRLSLSSQKRSWLRPSERSLNMIVSAGR